MAEKIMVDRDAIKEMFDFMYDTITDISDESPEYYQEMSKQYDIILEKIIGKVEA